MNASSAWPRLRRQILLVSVIVFNILVLAGVVWGVLYDLFPPRCAVSVSQNRFPQWCDSYPLRGGGFFLAMMLGACWLIGNLVFLVVWMWRRERAAEPV